MSNNEKVKVLEAMMSLDEKDKQFVLGYAMGVAVKVAEQQQEKEDSNDD